MCFGYCLFGGRSWLPTSSKKASSLRCAFWHPSSVASLPSALREIATAGDGDRSDVVAVWDEAKAFAFPICCIQIPPSQENLEEDHLALKLAREVVETAPPLSDHGCLALASQVSCACQMTAGIMAAMPRPCE